MKGDGDKGTKVLMYIPVIVTHIEEEEQDAHVSFDSHVSASILILDDESQITVYMKKILEGKGFLVHTENNPNAALTLFHKHINFFDLVICNLNMPDMSGVEFITKVRDMQKDVPIIMVSGDQPEKEITENEKLNISAYLTKPVTMATLETTINQVLSQK
jgi:two-component system response regulator AtoC